MPIADYDGETFVSFLDISGFKELMRDEKKALTALDNLYKNSFVILRNQTSEYKVEGIFISDSGILFIRRSNHSMLSSLDSLKVLLNIIKEINKKMIEFDLMLTSSIAYGKFKYEGRLEFEGIEKNPIFGYAYVSAFLDSENGKPKIQPGQCRLVKENLPTDIITAITQSQDNEDLRLIHERPGDNQHLYYYWMVSEPEGIETFENNYRDSYNLEYAGMLRALKGIYHLNSNCEYLKQRIIE